MRSEGENRKKSRSESQKPARRKPPSACKCPGGPLICICRGENETVWRAAAKRASARRLRMSWAAKTGGSNAPGHVCHEQAKASYSLCSTAAGWLGIMALINNSSLSRLVISILSHRAQQSSAPRLEIISSLSEAAPPRPRRAGA